MTSGVNVKNLFIYIPAYLLKVDTEKVLSRCHHFQCHINAPYCPKASTTQIKTAFTTFAPLAIVT